MFQRSTLNRAALIMLGAAAQLTSTGAKAQTAERIEITGSRIRSVGAVSNSPITSVGALEFNATQPVAVEDVIKTLPATVPAVGPGTNNGSGGGATIDLRGLGPTRSLVLINGRRMVPFNLNAQVDTNSIPVSLLERIDLVTGGASAVYGADAIAGVVNFVLKRNFSGVEASASYGLSAQGDSRRRRTDLTLGANLAEGRGNVVLSIGTTQTDPLRQSERAIGEFQINSGSGLRDGSPIGVPSVLAGLPAPLSGQRTVDPATGLLREYTAATDAYNFNPLNYFITPLERTQVTALGHYTLSEHAEAYAELLHTRSKVTQNVAPSGTFTATYALPIGNPTIPEGIRSQLCNAYGIAAANCVVGNPQEINLQIRRRFVELGPRISDFQNTTTQWTAGLRGSLPMFSDWSYDAYLQSGQTEQLQSRIDWGSFSKVQQALRSVAPGVCSNPANGCVPLNLFGAAGSITPQQLNFINLASLTTTSVQQRVASASITGEVAALSSPFARSGLNLALGAEAREVRAGNRSDAASQVQGEVLGTGAPTPDRSGSLRLNEAFVEAILPLAQNLPGVQAMNLEAGYRHTEFKTEVSSRNYGSWKLGMDWSPVRGLRLRASQQLATRAPHVNELYAPSVTGLAGRDVDPCQGDRINVQDANTPGTLSNLCVLTGVPLAQVGNVPAPASGQINNTSAGDPTLGPEEADTTTLGFVFEPSFAPGLSLTVDHFRIEVDKAISSATANQIIDACYTPALNAGLSGTNPNCRQIGRDIAGSLNGSALGVITPQSNQGKFAVSGVDIGASYSLPLKNLGLETGWGRLDFALNYSQLQRWTFKSVPEFAAIDCLGRYGANCGGPTFKRRATQRVNWTVGDAMLGLQWRHQGKVRAEGGTYQPAFSSIKAYDYIDLSAAWNITRQLRVALAVNNAFDSKPPLVGNTIASPGINSGNTFPQTYDVVGRAYSLSARLKF